MLISCDCKHRGPVIALRSYGEWLLIKADQTIHCFIASIFFNLEYNTIDH